LEQDYFSNGRPLMFGIDEIVHFSTLRLSLCIALVQLLLGFIKTTPWQYWPLLMRQ
jgi:hypothetical protein